MQIFHQEFVRKPSQSSSSSSGGTLSVLSVEMRTLHSNSETVDRISRLLHSTIASPIILKQYTKHVGYWNHSVIFITFLLAQSDPIKRWALYIQTQQ